MPDEDRKRARELAAEYLQKGDPTGWFEVLYREAAAGKSILPWADRGVNPGLLQFWKAHPQDTSGRSALVVACGLGDDAEQLAAWGFATTAFDIAETAIHSARLRFPASKVNYCVADLFAPPVEWQHAFHFVFEANTVQALPHNLRANAIRNIASFVRPGGKLLVIVRGREPQDPLGELPWPLTHAEMEEFVRAGLQQHLFDDYLDNEDPPTRRFRAVYARP
jgi:SAM-dependent methyltransferase